MQTTLHTNTIIQLVPCYTFMDIHPCFSAVSLLHHTAGQVPHLGHFFPICYNVSEVWHRRLWQKKQHLPFSFSHNKQQRVVPTNKPPSRISWTSFFHYPSELLDSLIIHPTVLNLQCIMYLHCLHAIQFNQAMNLGRLQVLIP